MLSIIQEADFVDKMQMLKYIELYFLLLHLKSFVLLQIAIMDGVTMGCGGGISIPGMFRVATDKTVCGSLYNHDSLIFKFE